MGEHITLQVADTGPVDAWVVEPATPPRGAIVVIQEIFGVNAHMRHVAERYAAEGFLALAPAMFDPVGKGIELGYDQAGMQQGMALVGELGVPRSVAIIEGAAKHLAATGLKVGAVGFCWGGSMAYLANTRLGLPAVSYYGARTVPFLGEPLQAPMLFHFGGQDTSIPPADIDAHRRAHPQAEVHVYDNARHAFDRDVDASHYDADSATLAFERSIAFFARTLAQPDRI